MFILFLLLKELKQIWNYYYNDQVYAWRSIGLKLVNGRTRRSVVYEQEVFSSRIRTVISCKSYIRPFASWSLIQTLLLWVSRLEDVQKAWALLHIISSTSFSEHSSSIHLWCQPFERMHVICTKTDKISRFGLRKM